MIDEDRGTCICGHELTADGACIVWDRHSVEHWFPSQGPTCSCHGRTIREVERREWFDAAR